MGPIELADQVGIDVGYKVAHVLEIAFGARMKVAAILLKLKEESALGKKTGKGFYLYAGRKKSSNPELTGWVRSTAASSGGAHAKLSAGEIQTRMFYIMINEAARCLDEKIVDSAAAVDIGMIFGTGFPPFRGGLLRYADSVGASAVVHELKRLQNTVSTERFAASRYLAELSEQKKNFYS